MIGQARVTIHEGRTISVDLDPPDARAFEISTEVLELLVETVNAGPIVRELAAEANRAHHLHGETSMRSAEWNHPRRVTILVEELGEIAEVMNDLDHGKLEPIRAVVDAREELVQLGAMVLDWISTLDDVLEAMT